MSITADNRSYDQEPAKLRFSTSHRINETGDTGEHNAISFRSIDSDDILNGKISSHKVILFRRSIEDSRARDNTSPIVEKKREVTGYVLSVNANAIICKVVIADGKEMQLELPPVLFDAPAVFGTKFSLSIDVSNGYKRAVVKILPDSQVETPEYLEAIQLFESL